MQFDTSTFPIVWLHAVEEGSDDELQDLLKFERLLDRSVPLVVITDHAFGTDRGADIGAILRKVDWARTNRPRLLKHIKALIQIEPNAGKRRAGCEFAQLFLTFWGYPLVFVEDEADAIGLALELLTGRGWAGPRSRSLH